MSMTVMKPGILVSLKTRVVGGVSYNRVDLRSDRDGEMETEEWQTTKTVQNAREFEKAGKMRSKASGLIRRCCIDTGFGLLCLVENEVALRDAVREAREKIERFNAKAEHSTIQLRVLRGRIAETDDEALRAISGELQDLLRGMRQGVKRLSVEEIRDAASRAKRVAEMLDEDQRKKVDKAVKQARSAAKKIAKMANEDADAIREGLAELDLSGMKKKRFKFLDLDADDEGEGDTDAMPSTSADRAAGVEV